MLCLWDMRPKAVDSGLAALAELRRAAAAGDPYPLMLVDRMMPEMDGFTLVEETRKEPAIAATTIMMLTSADRQSDAARCRRLRIAGYLVKPIKADELQSEMIAAFKGAMQNGQTSSRAKPETVDQAAGPTGQRSLRILLAEDNPVNQRVASYLLQKVGHSVKPVGNGREAIAALERENFDLVLMDVQMPEMDGFEATQAIRNSEAKTGRHVPIIAMTAHAMKGDRERCLQAGMDDYVSKPINKEDLSRAIQAATASTASPRRPALGPASAESVFDREAALEQVCGDEQLLSEVIDLFLVDASERMTEIRDALTQRDAKHLQSAAHALKGDAGCLGAAATATAALRLEEIGNNGNLAESGAALDKLDQELRRLTEAISAFALPA
jgi:CheY-like chemotaxis protein/HPt (histidine-containing phosphotransfer) domain-containing protein